MEAELADAQARLDAMRSDPEEARCAQGPNEPDEPADGAPPK
jgi:hypothetical protein